MRLSRLIVMVLIMWAFILAMNSKAHASDCANGVCNVSACKPATGYFDSIKHAPNVRTVSESCAPCRWKPGKLFSRIRNR